MLAMMRPGTSLFIAQQTNFSTSRGLRNGWYVVAWAHEISAG